MVSFCAIQTACWLFILIAILFLFLFIFSTYETISTQPHTCSRAQLLIGADCAKETRKVVLELIKINNTIQFVLKPSEHKEVAEKCDRVSKCLTRLTCSDGQTFAVDVKKTIPSCSFFSFYAGIFESCGEKLYTKRADYQCLTTLFDWNASRSASNRCEVWKSVQPCVQEAISMECNTSTDILRRYQEEALNFETSVCREGLIKERI